MKIKALEPIPVAVSIHETKTHAAGEVFEMDDDNAQSLIDQGRAEAVKEAAAKKDAGASPEDKSVKAAPQNKAAKKAPKKKG